jgi:electron transfer DM13
MRAGAGVERASVFGHGRLSRAAARALRNLGNQNYTIPSSVNLDRYPAAVVWCKRFSVAFGAAPAHLGAGA